MGVVYYLASSQPDRVNFDRDVESWLSDIWDSLDLDVQGDYQDNPHDFVFDQWEQEGNGYTEDEDGVEDGMIFVEDMAEAEARFKAVARKFMQSSTAKLATGMANCLTCHLKHGKKQRKKEQRKLKEETMGNNEELSARRKVL